MAFYSGTAGDDAYSGGSGDDLIEGRGGNDSLSGGDGWDVVNGGGGNDVLSGGPGRDTLTGAGGDDVIDGGADYDQIVGDGDFSFEIVADNVGPDGGPADGDIGTTGNFRGADAVEVRIVVPDLGPPSRVSLALFATGVDVGEEVEVLLNGVLLGRLNSAPLAGGRSATLFAVDPALLDPGGVNLVVARHTGSAGSEGWEMRLDKVSLTFGTSGNDRLSASGEGFRDSILGGAGDDHLMFGGVMFGGDGNDRLTGGPDSAFVLGGAGDDLLEGGGTWLYGDDDGPRGNSIQFLDPPSMAPGQALEHFFAFGTVAGTPDSASLKVSARDTEALAAGDPQQVEIWFNGHRLGLLGPVPEGGGSQTLFELDPAWIVPGDDNLVQIVNLGGTGPAIERIDVEFLSLQGDDEIRGDDQTQFAFGGGGADVISAQGGDDRLYGEDGDDILDGGEGDDLIEGGEGDDLLDGGAGDDSMAGGAGDDAYVVGSAGDNVTEAAGEGTDEVRTSLAGYSLLGTNLENLTATSAVAHDFRGNSGNNFITGGSGNDLLRLYDGGNDTVIAGAGNDNIFFGAALTAADVVTGGDGVDALVLQGNYAGGLTLSASVTQIENVSILGGNNTNFGEPGTNRYDYVLTTSDANFAAGVQARVNGAALLADEDFTFNGSAETDAKFVVYGGKGVDTLTGGYGNDIFIYPEERFAAGDTVNGGPGGYDGIFFRGNYTIDFNAPGYFGLMTSIENMTLTSATDERYARGGGTEFDYNIILADNMLLAGVELTVSGALLMATETMILDGSLEMDGTFRLFGGRANDVLKGGAQNDLLHGNLGADQLTGNGGVDTFRYDSTAHSNSGSRDEILDFTPGTDKIDLSRIDASTLAAGNQAFSWIGSNAFDGTAGQLRAFQSGGTWIVEGDTNGDSIADLVIALTLQGPTPLGAGDFLL